jgi:tetratricopeptide (TPR) repeat protein
MYPGVHQALKLEAKDDYVGASDKCLQVLQRHPANHLAKEVLRRDGQHVIELAANEVRQKNLNGQAAEALVEYKTALRLYQSAKASKVDLVWTAQLNSALKESYTQLAEKNYNEGTNALSIKQYHRAFRLFSDCLNYDKNYRDAAQLQKQAFDNARVTIYFAQPEGNGTVAIQIYTNIQQALSADPLITLTKKAPHSAKKPLAKTASSSTQAPNTKTLKPGKKQSRTTGSSDAAQQTTTASQTTSAEMPDNTPYVRLRVIEAIYSAGQISQTPQDGWVIRSDGQAGEKVTYYDCSGTATYQLHVAVDVVNPTDEQIKFTKEYSNNGTDALDYSTYNGNYQNITNVNPSYNQDPTNKFAPLGNMLAGTVLSLTSSGFHDRFQARSKFKQAAELSGPPLHQVAESIATDLKSFYESDEQ